MNFDDFKSNCPSKMLSDTCQLKPQPNVMELFATKGVLNACTEESCPTWYSMLFSVEIVCQNIEQGIIKVPQPTQVIETPTVWVEDGLS